MQAWDSIVQNIAAEREGLYMALQYLYTNDIPEYRIISILKASFTLLAVVIALSAGILLLINGGNGKY